MVLKEIALHTELDSSGLRWWPLVITVMNLLVSQNAKNILTNGTSTDFVTRILPHSVLLLVNNFVINCPRSKFCPDDGGNMFLRNCGRHSIITQRNALGHVNLHRSESLKFYVVVKWYGNYSHFSLSLSLSLFLSRYLHRMLDPSPYGAAICGVIV
jgi:hypothetical protein